MRLVELKIQDVAFGGKGVARESGKAVFIPFTIDGETVSADIVREKKKFAEAELREILDASPQRVQARCPYFGRCGGCAYQHIDYWHQLELKSRQVRDVLQRIGKLPDIPMRPIVPSSRPYQYRNRVTVHVTEGAIGFFQRDSHRLIDVESCPISVDEVNRQLEQLRRSNPREGHYTLRAHSGPRVFSQTNDEVADKLSEAVAAMIPDEQDLLIDAYCGMGFFAKALLPRFHRVIAIDWDRFAIQEAEKTATEKETYVAGDVATELERIAKDRSGRGSSTVIVDPPATGLPEQVRAQIIALQPTSFIYISCNPATLARDLAAMKEHFTMRSVTPFDMFPQTAEIEVAVHMSTTSSDNPSHAVAG